MLAVYPGSFDPITFGHLDLIERLSKTFDEVIVLVSDSSLKKYCFSSAQRKGLVERCLKNANADIGNVKVEINAGLTIDFVNQVKGHVMVRGVRSSVDLDHELLLANMNRQLAPNIETLVLFPNSRFQFISSSAIKEIAQFGGKLDDFVPPIAAQALREKYATK